MAAPFRLNAWVFASVKFEILGSIAGYSVHEAIGRWARAGSECTERQSYVLPESIAIGLFGPRAVEALVSAELAVRVEAGLEMLDMAGEIEWYAGSAGTSAGQRQRQRAGQARAAGAKRDARGRLLPSSATSGEPAAPVPLAPLDASATSGKPAESSVSNSNSDLGSQDQNPLTARAIPQPVPEPVDVGSYDPDDARQRGKLAEATYRGISDDRVRIAAELGVSAHPFPAITPASQPRSFRDLSQRIREEGRDAPAVCARVREALVAQARKTNSIEWLSEKAFTEGAWITAKEWIPGWRRAGSVPRATQKSSTVFDALDELAATVGTEAS